MFEFPLLFHNMILRHRSKLNTLLLDCERFATFPLIVAPLRSIEYTTYLLGIPWPINCVNDPFQCLDVARGNYGSP